MSDTAVQALLRRGPSKSHLYPNARITLAVDTPTFFAVTHSNQPLPPQDAAKPLQVSFEVSHKQEHTPAVPTAVLTISCGGIPMTRPHLIALTLLILSSSPACAEWVALGDNQARMTVYVNPDTIRCTGDVVKMWQLNDFSTIRTRVGNSYLSKMVVFPREPASYNSPPYGSE
jgi:hypothetical protein